MRSPVSLVKLGKKLPENGPRFDPYLHTLTEKSEFSRNDWGESKI